MQYSIGGLIYDTTTARKLACSGDEMNNDVLYITPNGKYFRCTCSPLMQPEITILTETEALCTYNRFAEKLVGYEDAFKNVDFRPA